MAGSSVELDEAAYALFEQAGGIRWPDSAKAQLSKAIQDSLGALAQSEVWQKTAVEARLKRVRQAIHALEALLGDVALNLRKDLFEQCLMDLRNEGAYLQDIKFGRRPANAHLDLLCIHVARIYLGIGGQLPQVGGKRQGSLTRLLTEIYRHLPDRLQCQSADAFAKQAQRALKTLKRETPVWKRSHPCGSSDPGLDEAIATAMSAKICAP